MSDLVRSLISEMTDAQSALDSLCSHLGHELPSDLEVLADEIGLDVVYTDELPDKVGGFLSQISDSGGIMAINSNKSKMFQIYSIAHEIGHFYLYHDSDNTGNAYEKERRANMFAFLLLTRTVPPDQLRGFLKDNPEMFEFTYAFGATAIALLFGKVPWLAFPVLGVFSFFMFREMLSDRPALPPTQEEKP